MLLFRRKRKQGKRSAAAPAPDAGQNAYGSREAQASYEVSDRDILNGIAAQASRSVQRDQGPRQSVIESQHVRDDGGNFKPQAGTSGEVYGQNLSNAYLGEEAERQEDQEGAAGVQEEPKPKRLGLLGRLRQRLTGAAVVFAGLGIFAAAFFIVYQGSICVYEWMHTSETFVTKHIDITGNVRLSRDMLLHLAGVKEGDNIFSVSVTEMERKLRETPWVQDVSVQRILPDRFVLRVHERMPSFWVRINDRLYYANETGEPIAPVESDNFMALPLLRVVPGCEEALPYLARIWRDLRSGTLPVEPGAVATVDVTPSNGIDMFFEDREMRLSVSPDDWEGNLTRIGMTFGDLASRRELARVREIRASGGSVWVVLRSQGQ